MKKSTQFLRGILLYIVVLLAPTAAKSQQSLIQITQWNWNAYVHVPADYASNPNKVYPTIIFFPGIGEIGTNASLVIANGPGAYLTQGWDGNVSIGTADSVEFIIASVQPVQSWPVNVQTQAVIQALKGLYRVDPNKLYLTGLSMGGWECSQFVTGDPYGGPYTYASQVAAEVNVEGVAINDAAPNLILWDNFAKSGGRIACFEQSNDFRDMQVYVNQMDSVKPGSAQYTKTSFGDGSHCCWSSFYGGDGATPTNFVLDGVSQNIYQWLAKQSLTAQGNAIPSITSATTASGIIGTVFSYTIAASNVPTSYAASGLPAGLTVNTSTGIISGTPTATGTSSVTLKATNANGSGTATLAITINPPAPVISSAATASGTVGTAFSYAIIASNTPTLYTVVGLPSGLNLNTSTGAISGTPTTVGTYSVIINAVNAGGTGTKTLTITISAALAAPVISSAATATGMVGTAFSYTITASNTPTSYAAASLPVGLTVNTSTGVISGTPTTAGTSSVTVSAINATGTGTKALTITINIAPPVISSAATATGTVGSAFSYTITASNTPTSYTVSGIPAGLGLNTATGVISGTPTTAGTSSITIGAINAGGTGTKTLTITINAAVVAPVISSSTSASGIVGTAFNYSITASNTPTSYTVSGVPTGLSLNTSTGVISGTPTTAGTSSITIGAINAAGTGTATLIITINPPAPVISSATSASGIVGTTFSYTITASNTPTSYAASGLPAGLTINTSTGVISGTPTIAGTSSVTASAINAGGTGTKTLTITINPAVPVISSAATASGIVGTAFSYTITASNIPTSYAASGLPAGLTINASTGIISGTPTTAGTSATTISAINAGGTGTKTLTITINPAIPVISSAATATGIVGTVFSYTITASNTPTSYTVSGVPAGLGLNTSTGVISGTPTTSGTSSITIGAINAGGTGIKTLTITINPPAPVISSATSASGIVGTAFSYTITASNTPTSYTASGLPTGLTLNTSTGVISGTPTTAGTSSVSISAINAGGTGTKTLTITINPAIPVISSSATATGTIGTAFSYTITASNTPSSYAASGLPAGLTVNTSTGIISGTLTTAGTSSVTISAINTGGTGSKTLTITVSATIAAPVISSAASASGTVGTAFSYTITASNTPTSYTATGLPAGLTVNTSTGVISGIPTTAGTSNVTISAINAGGTGTKTLTITVSAAAKPNPVANAGADQTIALPTNSVTLSGSGTDVNGTISSYKWSKISGPITAMITDSIVAATTVTGLTQGVYQFVLTVTDISGVTGKDTVQITVNASSVTSTNQLPASDTATWALTVDKTVTVKGPGINAGSMLPGSNFPNPGVENTDGYKSVITAVNWPTVSTDGYNIDFPLSPASGANLNITGLTFTAKISGSSGNTMFSLAYQEDNTGFWIPFGTPQVALSGGIRSVDFGTLNQLLSNGHSYTIRVYVYSSSATTSNSRNVYIKNVSFTLAASAAASNLQAAVAANTLSSVSSANSVVLSAYPNPVSNMLVAKTDIFTLNQNVLITLTDVRGKILYQKNIFVTQQTTDLQIDMSKFGNGMYFLNATTSGGKKTTKEIIKN